MRTNLNKGQGARDGVTTTREALTRAIREAESDALAEHQSELAHARKGARRHDLSELAESFTRSFVRRWQAWGGRELSALDVEEVSAIYHAHFAVAFTRCGVAPVDKRALYQKQDNALPFRALLIWHREYKTASKQIRSYLWGRGAEDCHIEPLATPFEINQLAAMFGGADKSDARRWCGIEIEAEPWERRVAECAPDAAFALGHVRAAFNTPSAHPLDVQRVRRQLRHARWCLRAFWMVGASRKWRAGFVADNDLLRVAALVVRGNGLAPLDKLGLLNGRKTTATGGALRVAVHRLKQRLDAGDRLLTEAPERVAEAFVTCMGNRPAARRLVADLLPDASVERLATVTS